MDFIGLKISLVDEQEAKNIRIRDLQAAKEISDKDADALVAANDMATIALMDQCDAVHAGEMARRQRDRDEADQVATERERTTAAKAAASLKAERDQLAGILHANGLDLRPFTVWLDDAGGVVLVDGEKGSGKQLAAFRATDKRHAMGLLAGVDVQGLIDAVTAEPVPDVQPIVVSG